MFEGVGFEIITADGFIKMPYWIYSPVIDSGNDSLMITGIDNFLVGYTIIGWNNLKTALSGLSGSSEHMTEHVRLFISRAFQCRIDHERYILLSSDLVKFASLKHKIVIIGLNDRFEIMSYKNWSEMKENIKQRESDLYKYIRKSRHIPDIRA